MLLQQTIDPAPAARLAAMVEQYLTAGGSIDQLPGPTFTPPPPRKHPATGAKKPRKELLPAHIRRYRESGPKVLELFDRGATIREISREVGRTDSFVHSCLDYFGIDARAVRAEQKEAELKETIEQIRVLARDGHSARFIAEQLGISPNKVLYHAGRHEIDFRRE